MIEERAIEERAREYILNANNTIELPARRYGCYVGQLRSAYIAGAKEQKAIDDEFCKSGEASDGYHTFNELYDFRREYNAALVNSGVWKAHKSHRHHDGELCFGGGWAKKLFNPLQF